MVIRIGARGVSCEHRLFVVLDSSDVLLASLSKFFADAIVQRCIVHKERNIKGKLSKGHWVNWPDDSEDFEAFRGLRRWQKSSEGC